MTTDDDPSGGSSIGGPSEEAKSFSSSLATTIDEIVAFGDLFPLVAHELAQPLAAALGGALTLERPDLDDEMQRVMKDLVVRNLRQASALVEMFTIFGSVEARKLKVYPQEISLSVLLDDCVADFNARFDEVDVEVDCPKDLRVVVDIILIRQVLSNLLSNAKKFSDPGTRIRVTGERRNGEVVISVRNQGMGFSPDEAERIFEPRVRLDPQGPGLGLGLYVSRAIVAAHGGRIWAEGEPHTGATFRVAIPV